MRSPLLLITFIIAAIQCAHGAPKPLFYAARGEYRLSATTTLTVSKGEQAVQFSLKSVVQQANTPTTVSHGGELPGTNSGERFLLYWDSGTQTLWWTTAQRIGFCDISHPQSGKSSSHERAIAFHEYDEFPPRPSVFIAELERVLPVHP